MLPSLALHSRGAIISVESASLFWEFEVLAGSKTQPLGNVGKRIEIIAWNRRKLVSTINMFNGATNGSTGAKVEDGWLVSSSTENMILLGLMSL